MPVSKTTPGRLGARVVAPIRVAFRHRNDVGTQDEGTFAAQWLDTKNVSTRPGSKPEVGPRNRYPPATDIVRPSASPPAAGDVPGSSSPCQRLAHQAVPRAIHRYCSSELRTDCLINIERIRWLGLGICLHDFRHDEYTRNWLLDYVDNRRFGLRSLHNHHFGLRCLSLGRRSPSSRSRLLRSRSSRLGACFLSFCFGLERALRGLLLWRFRFLGGLLKCLFRCLCLPCFCPFGPFGHHTLALIGRPRGTRMS